MLEFAWQEDVDVTDLDVGRFHDCRDHRFQSVRNSLCRFAIEEVAAVLEPDVDAAFVAEVLGEVEHQIELGCVLLEFERIAARLLPAVIADHDLEQRITCQSTRRIEALHHRFEGNVSVGEGLEISLANAIHQLPERRVTRRIRAQHNRIDEEADQFVESMLTTSGDGSAEGKVLTRSERSQQRRRRRVQNHEHRTPALARQISQCSSCLHAQPCHHCTTGETRSGRSTPVGGKQQFFGGSVQTLRPEVQLRAQDARRIVGAAE